MNLTSFGETQPSLAWDFNGTASSYIGSVSPTSANINGTYQITTTWPDYNTSGKYGSSIVLSNPGAPTTINNCIFYNATSGINIPFGGSNTSTICFWYKFLSAPGGTSDNTLVFLTYGQGSKTSYIFAKNPSTAIGSYGNFAGAAAGIPNSGSSQVTVGTWYHVAQTTTNTTQVLYVNGVQVGSRTYTAIEGNASNVWNCMSLGTYFFGTNPSTGASAELDDLRVYRTALSAAQVQSIYQAQGMPSRGTMISNDRQIYVAPTGTYPSYTPTSGAQFPVFNTSNVSFYSSGGTSVGTVGQYLAFGSQTFNMSRGFSAVCQFAWTNGIGVWERILDFGNGAGNNNILLTRVNNGTNLYFGYLIGSTDYSVTAVGSIPAQNTLYTVVAIYDPSKPLLSLYVNGTLTSSIPAVVARDTRTLTQTYVGRSNWGSDAYSNVNVNYLSVYNRVLTSDEINRPLPTPQITLKGAPLFNQLSPSATSSAVGAFSLRAVNGTSAKAVQVRVEQPVGAFTGPSGQYGTASSSSNYDPTNFPPWIAFNKILFTYFWASGANYTQGVARTSGTVTVANAVNYYGDWLQIQFPSAFVPVSYSIAPQSAAGGTAAVNTPGTWYFFGSIDSSTWVLLDTRSGIANSALLAGSYTTYNLNGVSTAYSYYRIVCNIVSLNTSFSIAEMVISTTQDFYADERGNLLTAPVVGTTLQNWLGGATGYVTKWYDQSGRGNDAIQNTAANQPIIQRATKGPGYSTLWPGLASTRLIYGTSSNLFDSTNYSVCVAAKRTAAIATTTYYAGTNGQAVANQNLGVGYSNDTTLRLSEYGYSLNAPTVSGYAGVSEPLGYDFFTFSQTSGMRNYTRRSGTSASNSNTTLTTPLTRSGNSTIGGTNDSASFTGEIYELLVFTQSLYDLDTTGGLITQIYQNQLSYTGT
jgi:hypothetical protein